MLGFPSFCPGSLCYLCSAGYREEPVVFRHAEGFQGAFTAIYADKVIKLIVFCMMNVSWTETDEGGCASKPATSQSVQCKLERKQAATRLVATTGDDDENGVSGLYIHDSVVVESSLQATSLRQQKLECSSFGLRSVVAGRMCIWWSVRRR